jgi:hypothetical protein
MKIILRLIGYSEIYNDNKYIYDIFFTSFKKFNFNILRELFVTSEKHSFSLNNITNEELNMCALNYVSLNLKKETIYDESDTDIKIYKIFIYCGHSIVKDKLIQIFKKYGILSLHDKEYLYNEIIENESITNIINCIDDVDNKINDDIDNKTYDNDKTNEDIDKTDDIDKTNEDIDKTNEDIDIETDDTYIGVEDDIKSEIEDSDNKIFLKSDSDDENDDEDENEEYIDNNDDDDEIIYNEELFNDEDFIKLINIYKNKPHLLKELYNYVSSSKITIIPKHTVKINEHTVKINEKTVKINEQKVNIIKNITDKGKLNFNEEDISKALLLTNNNINLSIRYLLNELN